MARALSRDVNLVPQKDELCERGEFYWNESEQRWLPLSKWPPRVGAQCVQLSTLAIFWVVYTSELTLSLHRGDGGPALMNVNDGVEWWMNDQRIDDHPECLALERVWREAAVGYERARVAAMTPALNTRSRRLLA